MWLIENLTIEAMTTIKKPLTITHWDKIKREIREQEEAEKLEQ